MGQHLLHPLAAAAAAVLLGWAAPATECAAFEIGFVVNGGVESTNVFGAVLPPGQHVQPYYQQQINQPPYSSLSEGRSQSLLDLTGADARSRASFGDLGVYVHTWAAARMVDVYGAWVSNTSAAAAFSDVWTITAPGHATGAPATMAVQVQLDGTLTPKSDHFQTSLCVSLTSYLPDGAHQIDLCPTAAGTYSLTVPVRLNTEFGLAMGLQAFASAYNQWAPGSSTVDFYDSATVAGLNLWDNGGQALVGYSLTAGSGHVYLPVPEPAAWALMLVGLLAVGQAARGWQDTPPRAIPSRPKPTGAHP